MPAQVACDIIFNTKLKVGSEEHVTVTEYVQ